MLPKMYLYSIHQKCICIAYTKNTWRFLKFENHCGCCTALPNWPSSCAVMFVSSTPHCGRGIVSRQSYIVFKGHHLSCHITWSCITRLPPLGTHHKQRPVNPCHLLSCIAIFHYSNSQIITLILRRSRMGTAWFYTSTSNKRAARPKLYTKSLTRDLKTYV